LYYRYSPWHTKKKPVAWTQTEWKIAYLHTKPVSLIPWIENGTKHLLRPELVYTIILYQMQVPYNTVPINIQPVPIVGIDYFNSEYNLPLSIIDYNSYIASYYKVVYQWLDLRKYIRRCSKSSDASPLLKGSQRFVDRYKSVSILDLNLEYISGFRKVSTIVVPFLLGQS
jgi:hypothetical protein